MLKRPLFTIATLAAATLGLVALSASFQAPGQGARQKVEAWEFLVETDVTAEQVEEMSQDGWQYVGYLGESAAGDRVDETLWKRPAR